MNRKSIVVHAGPSSSNRQHGCVAARRFGDGGGEVEFYIGGKVCPNYIQPRLVMTVGECGLINGYWGNIACEAYHAVETGLTDCLSSGRRWIWAPGSRWRCIDYVLVAHSNI